MAIGYGKIILTKFDDYYVDLISEISSKYQLFIYGTQDFFSLNNDGDTIVNNIQEAKETLLKEKKLYVKFTNSLDSTITLSISEIDNYLIEENYSMEELLSEDEKKDLLKYLQNRFNRLLASEIAIGFVFDQKGYSEDYILIPPPNWREANECWRKLMGG